MSARVDVRARLARLARLIRRIAGMPDYERYVEHLRLHHPGCAVPTEHEYYALHLKGRYESGVNRCC